ncbi:MAG: hypothetical protein JNM34_11675 [Chthonomonadaceae bacterium]|nr:hypothetical protein [Chthonomonadaceae bacterium]
MVDRFYEAMSQLSPVRPCFHSEADFQFALAWQLKVLNPEADIRLEVPVRVANATFKLDILIMERGRRTAIELKYFKAPLQFDHSGETFALVDAVAHDINRYDALKDVYRLEQMLGGGAVDAGYAILLTNQPKYWSQRNSVGRVDEAFGLEDGRPISGTLEWAAHTGGTNKGRERPIRLAGLYEARWQEYSRLDTERFGHFRWLCIQAAPGIQTPESTISRPGVRRVVRTPRQARNYGELKALLERTEGASVRLGFGEIESVMGELPMSARKHTAWWGNHKGNPQSVWLAAGWVVSRTDLEAEFVVFVRS